MKKGPSDRELVGRAWAASHHARAPHSQFKVGAAALTSDGRIFTGCNIEVSVYGLTICAERVAVFKAISEGARQILKVAIVADSEKVAPPCGACRQVIWEFGTEQTQVIMANAAGQIKKLKIAQLLPLPFDESFL
jgi:cytidine deaminase